MASPLLALACCGILLITCGVIFSLGLFLPDLCIVFNASKFEVSLAASIQHSLLLGTGVFGGHLVELYGCHIVCAVGSLAVALGLLLSVFTTHIIYFYLTYSVLAGIGLGFQFVPMVMAMAQGYSVRHRAVAMAVVQSGAGLGTLALSPVIQIAIEEYSWWGAYLLLSGFALNAVPFAMVMRMSLIVPDDGEKERKDEPKVPMNTYNSVERLQDSVNYMSQVLHRSQRDLSVAVRLALHSRSDLKMNTNPGSHDTLQLDGELIHHSRCDLRMNGGPGYHSLSSLHVNNERWCHSRTSQLNEQNDSPHCSNHSLHKHHLHLDNNSHHSKHHHAGGSQLHAKSGKSSTYSVNTSMRDSAVSVTYEVQPATEAKPHIIDKLQKMFDFSLVLDGRFFWPLLADVMLGLAVFAPIPLISPRAILLGVTPFQAALLMSIFGALNIVGRLVTGIVAMLFGGITTLLVVSICMAVICSLAPLYTTYPSMALMAVLYGLSFGGVMTLESLIAGETVEVERVHKAIGLQYSIQSIAVAISYPLAAALWETTDCMEAPFYLLAVCSALAAISLLVWHVRYRCHCKPDETTAEVQDEDADEVVHLDAPKSHIT